MDAMEVELTSVEEFRDRFARSIDQAAGALNGLAQAAAPALGGFHDAVETARRHEALRADYLARLRRLLWTLVAARDLTTSVLATYRDGVTVSVEMLRDVDRFLDPGVELPWLASLPGFGTEGAIDRGTRRA